MAALSISRAWDEARVIITREGKLLSAVALALIVLPQVIAGVIAPPIEGGEGKLQLFALVTGLIGLVAQLALIRLALGPSISVGEAIGHGFRRFPMLLLAMFLLGLLFLVLLIPFGFVGVMMGLSAPSPGQVPDARVGGAILLMLLVLIAASAKFVMMAPAASAEHIGPIKIIRRSWQLTSGNYFRFLALILLFVVLAVVLTGAATLLGGIIGRLIDPEMSPFSVSAFVVSLATGIAQGVFSVIASVMLARVYVQLAGTSQAEVSVPTTSD